MSHKMLSPYPPPNNRMHEASGIVKGLRGMIGHEHIILVSLFRDARVQRLSS